MHINQVAKIEKNIGVIILMTNVKSKIILFYSKMFYHIFVFIPLQLNVYGKI